MDEPRRQARQSDQHQLDAIRLSDDERLMGVEVENCRLRSQNPANSTTASCVGDALNGSEEVVPSRERLGNAVTRRSSLVKDLDRRPVNRIKKTVSFTQMPNERKITSVQDCIAYMMRGSKLIKLRSNSRQYWRTFTLDADKSAIRWDSHSKKPDQAKVPVSSMKEILVGKRTEVFRAREAADYAEDCAFSIVYGNHYATLDLFANDVDEANIWVTGLMSLITDTNELSTDDRANGERDSWLIHCFDERIRAVHSDKDCLSQDEELHCRKVDESLVINAHGFLELYKNITTRAEIYHILIRHANKEYMNVDDLITFLESEQGLNNPSREHVIALIDQYEPSPSGRMSFHLHIEGLTRFLLSETCFDPEQRLVCQDMTQPLTSYYIASSHNTYLVEDQLKGPSSVEGYTQALLNGCRFLEMDVWDGADNDPVIFHGHTLTSKVPFRRALEAIRIHAFEKSHYPLIINIEIHCSLKQQLILVNLLKSSLGQMLVKEPVEDSCLESLPSPESLKNKILILGRKLEKTVIGPNDLDGEVTEDDESAESIKCRDPQRSAERQGSVKRIRLAREFSDLVNYCQFQRFSSFADSLKDGNCCHVESIPECVAIKLAHSTPDDFVQHCRRTLTRVYPSGIRVDSSNFSPQDMWNCGVQLATMNYQSVGLMMDLNTARFSQNGNCGYVLKPAVMREEFPVYSTHGKEIPGVTPQTVHIKIISAINLPKPTGAATKGDVIDPFVKLEIYGIPSDCFEFRTKTVLNNGFNPVFDETFEFQLNFPELALIRFAILDDECIGDDFIGQYCIPMECMRTGYRHVKVKSLYGKDIPSCYLFVHIAVTDRSGGGKTMRTGISGLLLRHHRPVEGLKYLGVKAVDDLIKATNPVFKESTDMKEHFLRAFLVFKEECSQNQVASVKQCVRALLNKFPTSAGENSPLKIEIHGPYPEISLTGAVSDNPRKIITAFEHVIAQCRHVAGNADRIATALQVAHKALLELYEEMQAPSSPGSIGKRKNTKLSESICWNIRTIKGHIDGVKQTLFDCQDFVKKVREALSAGAGLTHYV